MNAKSPDGNPSRRKHYGCGWGAAALITTARLPLSTFSNIADAGCYISACTFHTAAPASTTSTAPITYNAN